MFSPKFGLNAIRWFFRVSSRLIWWYRANNISTVSARMKSTSLLHSETCGWHSRVQFFWSQLLRGMHCNVSKILLDIVELCNKMKGKLSWYFSYQWAARIQYKFLFFTPTKTSEVNNWMRVWWITEFSRHRNHWSPVPEVTFSRHRNNWSLLLEVTFNRNRNYWAPLPEVTLRRHLNHWSPFPEVTFSRRRNHWAFLSVASKWNNIIGMDCGISKMFLVF